jgi:hypothetical protein
MTSPRENWRAILRNMVLTKGIRRLMGAQQNVYLAFSQGWQ